jgi:hypothetical protein
MKPSLDNMHIVAEKQVKLTQLIVHGEIFKYRAGGQMLALLELAQAQAGVDAASINRVLLGGGLYHVAETLLKGALACELLVVQDGKCLLSEYGHASLREGRAWASMHTSVMAIGILEALAPGPAGDHPMHLVARLDTKDHLDKFTLVDSAQGGRSPSVAQFLQRLEERVKWQALSEDGGSGHEARSFDALLLKSSGSRMFSNSMQALVAAEWCPAAKGQSAQWEVKKVETLNQSPTPLKKLLDHLVGNRLPATSEIMIAPLLADGGFLRQANGSFVYARDDALARSVIDVRELTFEQRIKTDGWGFKVKGRLVASSPHQALQWYFAKVFKADKIFTIEALREDYDAYARKAGQAEPVTDEELRSAFYAGVSPTKRAAHSRRGFFLHFPR